MGLNHEDKTILWCISQIIKDVKNLAETKSNQGWFLHVNWWKRMKTWSQSELYNQESRTYKRRFCQIWNKILILNIKLSVMEYFILIIYLFTVFTNWFFFYLFFFFPVPSFGRLSFSSRSELLWQKSNCYKFPQDEPHYFWLWLWWEFCSHCFRTCTVTLTTPLWKMTAV